MSTNPGTEKFTGDQRGGSRKLFVIFVCASLFILYSALVLTKPISQDEGVFLTIGKYITHGWLPYRDIVDHKPPAIYFLLAGVCTLFGPSIFSGKIALIVCTFGSAVLVGKVGAILKPGIGWLTASLFLFLMTQFEGYFLITEPFLLLPLLLCLWLLLHPKSSRWGFFAAGVALSVAILFKQTAIISAIPLIILAVRLPKKGIPVFIAGMLLPWVGLGLYFVTQGIVAAAWHNIVVLNLTSYPREPLGYVLSLLRDSFLWTLPVWLLLCLGLRCQMPMKKILLALIAAPLPFMFFRHYPHYWIQLLPFVAVIAATALTGRSNRWLTMVLMTFCLGVAGGKVAQEAVPNYRLLREQLHVAKLLNHEPATTVLAENKFTGFYFLLTKPPLNKFIFITEITDADAAERQTIADLQRDQSVMILWPARPNNAYAKKLQKFIWANTTTTKSFPVLGLEVLTYRLATSR